MTTDGIEHKIETVAVKHCAEGNATFYFQQVCLCSNRLYCRYQGVMKDVQGRKYNECNKFGQDKRANGTPM